MNIQTISTKELREKLPVIRAGLLRGEQYTLIYRSKPIARLEPINEPVAKVRLSGGKLRLQENSKVKLTPAYLNEISRKRYG